jgi:hypothetical protein
MHQRRPVPTQRQQASDQYEGDESDVEDENQIGQGAVEHACIDSLRDVSDAPSSASPGAVGTHTR